MVGSSADKQELVSTARRKSSASTLEKSSWKKYYYCKFDKLYWQETLLNFGNCGKDCSSNLRCILVTHEKQGNYNSTKHLTFNRVTFFKIHFFSSLIMQEMPKALNKVRGEVRVHVSQWEWNCVSMKCGVLNSFLLCDLLVLLQYREELYILIKFQQCKLPKQLINLF